MTLQGKRILVVEDEYMIATDLKQALVGQGAIVVGPTGDLADALELVDEEDVEAAILDLNLEGEWTYPIADSLEERGVPYLFVTGYDRWAVAEKYVGKPTIAKPYSLASVVRGVEELLGRGNSA